MASAPQSAVRRIGARIRAYIEDQIGAFVASALAPGKGDPAADLVERWRNGFWGQLAAIRASREPAHTLLPEDERDWRPATWRHFRFVVIRHLRDEGAHSLEELVQDPPAVLGLGLDRRELKAVLDSARRRGEIAAKKSTHPSSRGIEWIVTDHGRKVTAHALSWVFAQGSNLRTWAAPAATAFSVFGIGISKPHGPSIGLLVAVSILAGSLVWLLASVRSVTSGAKAGRRVARDWSRWAREYPGWYRIAFRPFPRRSALLGTLTLAMAVTFYASGDAIPFYVLAAVAFGSLARVVAWKERWDAIRPQREAPGQANYNS